MRRFLIHNTRGEIIRTGSCPEEFLSYQAIDEGETMRPLDDSTCTDVTHYWNGQSTAIRQELPPCCERTSISADGLDAAEFTFPDDIQPLVQITGPDIYEELLVTDGLLTFTTEHQGAYRFVLDLFPYRNQEIVIHAI